MLHPQGRSVTKVGRDAFVDDLPLVHDIEPIRDREGGVDPLLDQQHGGALTLQPTNHL
jgi:hypothetical protein